jgi:hypothetical protein
MDPEIYPLGNFNLCLVKCLTGEIRGACAGRGKLSLLHDPHPLQNLCCVTSIFLAPIPVGLGGFPIITPSHRHYPASLLPGLEGHLSEVPFGRYTLGGVSIISGANSGVC